MQISSHFAAADRRSGAWLALLALASLSFGCSEDPKRVSTLPDAGDGMPTDRRFAAASAALRAVDSNEPAALEGTGQFRATELGVDMELSLPGCSDPSPVSVEILEAGDCSPASLQAPVWRDGLGAGIPEINCQSTTSGFGLLRYARRAGRSGSWTIGGPASSDLVDRILVLRNRQDGRARMCGVIERTQDIVWTALPAPDEPPSAAVRAQLSGQCFARALTGNAAEGCPDEAALTRCTNTHCDLGSCIEACSEYTRCLDPAVDPCIGGSTCPQSDACAQCQGALLSCTLSYCAEHLSCVLPIRQDGPCGELLACCALQGEDAARCLPIFGVALGGGDASCIGAIYDRETVGHLRSPCTFGDIAAQDAASTPGRQMQPESEPLADDTAGTSCSRDADCPGGQCAATPQLPDTTSSEGYCTRACTTKSECGLGGSCISRGDEGGRCLASCGSHGECRTGFLCGGTVNLPVLGNPGACLPMRPADSLADRVAGGACADDADCPGGQCATRDLLGAPYPGNYCTGRCYEDGQCGAGGACMRPLGSVDPGYCLLTCETHADCARDGYRCRAMNDGTRLLHACYPGATPLPDHSVGLPCNAGTDCGSQHAQCAKEMPYGSFSEPEVAPAPGGYCTQRCALDEDCGAGAECLNVNIRGGLCMASCTDAAPCRNGYTCLAHLRDGPTARVCVPVAP